MFKVGEKVHYAANHCDPENGIVKEVRGDTIFVVYYCNGEWHRYKDYTGCATNIRDLKEGWLFAG